MKTDVLLIRERIEVGAPRNGKPGYRWTNGYYVVDKDGGKIYPPVIRREAYDLARQLYGNNIRVIFGD